MVNTKYVFWQALLSAIFIFGVGLLLGFWLESSRANKVETGLLNSEINVLDNQLIQMVNENFDIECEPAVDNLINFADMIYWEARELENYDAKAQLTDEFKILHRRYDVLRMILWNQAVELKKRCGADFHTVVYIYKYEDVSFGLKAEQVTFSRFLGDMKERYGNEIILIPIAGDLGLSSIELIKDKYDIEKYPVIVIDEKSVIREIVELDRLDELIADLIADNSGKIVLR